MDVFLEEVYLRELRTQCGYAIASVDRMNEVLGDPGEFFREAGDFLQHSSAVSRMLWPPSKKKRAIARGRVLREGLGVPGSHVLQSRTLRDHFEHFDERLDDWAKNSPNRNLIDNMIGPRSAIGGDAITDGDIMRMFEPDTKRLVFRGQPFDVQALVDGVIDIQRRADERLAELDRIRRTGGQ